MTTIMARCNDLPARFPAARVLWLLAGACFRLAGCQDRRFKPPAVSPEEVARRRSRSTTRTASAPSTPRRPSTAPPCATVSERSTRAAPGNSGPADRRPDCLVSGGQGRFGVGPVRGHAGRQAVGRRHGEVRAGEVHGRRFQAGGGGERHPRLGPDRDGGGRARASPTASTASRSRSRSAARRRSPPATTPRPSSATKSPPTSVPRSKLRLRSS